MIGWHTQPNYSDARMFLRDHCYIAVKDKPSIYIANHRPDMI